MIETVVDLFQRLFAGNHLDTTDVLRLILLATTAAATAHLATMLATRWGDHNVATKSLMFSVLAHAMCWMGMATIPLAVISSLPDKDDLPEQVTQVRQILVESEQTVETAESGNTPIQDSIVDDKSDLARLEHTSSELNPLESIDRNTENPTPVDVPIRDPEQPEVDDTAALAIPEDQAESGPRQTSSAPLTAPETPPEARPESQANVPSRSRLPIARIGNDELEFQRQPQKGSFEKVSDEIEPDTEAPELDSSTDPNGMFAKDDGEQVRRRAGPIPATIVEDLAGAPTESDSKTGAAGAASERRMSRLSTQRRPDRPGRAVDSQRQKQIAKTPIPLDEKYEQVRESPTLSAMSDALEFKPADPDFDANPNRRRANVPATYRLRNLQNRAAIARRFGGTTESERAVERSLAWLARQQHPDGHWDASRFGSGQIEFDENRVDRRFAGRDADTGITALAILAFLGAGYTQEEGKYTRTVSEALNWLMAQQASDGNLSGNATHFARMYCHAMATYALGEASGMQSDPTLDIRLRSVLLRAVTYIVAQQNRKDGGWRYLRTQQGDMSMFGWQLMALKSAELAGVKIPNVKIRGETTKSLMIKFLRQRSEGRDGGLAAYRQGDPVTPTMTAEALFCRQMLGYRHSTSARLEAVEYLTEHLPRMNNYNLYYWYYGTLAMYQHGGEAWTTWNTALRDMLIFEQRKAGPNSGSWDPRGVYGPYGGRIYSTAIATLSLEVYYRFLPLYNRGIPGADEQFED
jgi:hypothetical protein